MYQPFVNKNHAQQLVNIASGRINADSSVNAEMAFDIGKSQLANFIEKLPTGFYESLVTDQKVKYMNSDKKGMKIGDKEVYDTAAIYARIIGLLATGQATLEDVIKFELSAVPTSMFDEHGDMRIDKGKSTLKNKLQVETPSRNSIDTCASFIDGCAVFWILNWPDKCTVEDIAQNMYSYVTDMLCYQDVYLIFDKYLPSGADTGKNMGL